MRSVKKLSALIVLGAAVAGCGEERVYHTRERVVDRPVRVYDRDPRPDYYSRDNRTFDRDRTSYDYDAPRTQTRVEVSGDNASASAGAYSESYSNGNYNSSSSYDDGSTVDVVVE